VLWLAVLLAVIQAGVSLFVRTQRVRGYLIAHLEGAFGRPVEAGSFSVRIFPVPQLSIDNVTIGEDPAFGHEYFLRAENMAASLRWSGLLRGHFEFGTMSLTRPSLILVRNANGRWNLEDWLPPAGGARSAAGRTVAIYGPQPSSESTHHLQKIEFDDGRINFKVGDEKRPFAFVAVSGSVEQVDAGRWQLRLEAQPWRSGAGLQSTGTLRVSGDVAGTSARLQPAQIRVHWDKVSLADLFRLATGNDSGVRGEFALDGVASVGKAEPGELAAPGQWKFEAQARTTEIHRWNLTERNDNPRVNVNLKGVWNLIGGEVSAETLSVELPHSRLEGSATMDTKGAAAWRVKVNSAAVQAQDLLAWWRAFQPGVAEELIAEQTFTGSGELHGWPLQFDAAEIASKGGTLGVPDLGQPVQIDPFQGALHGRRLIVEPVRMVLGNSVPRGERTSAKLRPGAFSQNTVESVLLEDFASGEGVLRVYARLADAKRMFRVAEAFGRPLNHGWELSGGVGGRVELAWQRGLRNRRWSAAFDLSKAELQAAGLNLPLKLDDVHVEAKDGQRKAELTRVGAFGGVWSGTISETIARAGEEATSAGDSPNRWQFSLHTDLLDAAELDRWFGPRARPSWLQRLLPALLSSSGDKGAKPSELLRRISAQGEISADTLIVEKVKLAHASAQLTMRDLHLEARDAQAQWAGGTMGGELQAEFSPTPEYEVRAQFTKVNLAQLPWTPRWAERWSGAASGAIHLATEGVGREKLLSELTGQGAVQLSDVEFRGWDVPGSVEAGVVRTGTSRWTNGAGEFSLDGHNIQLESVRLETAKGKTELTGTIGFGQDGKLVFTPAAPEKRMPRATATSTQRVLQVNGPLDTPSVLMTPATTGRVAPPGD